MSAPPPGPPGQPHGSPGAPSPQSETSRTVLIVLMLGLGALTCCGGACIAGAPFGLFLLGGGGDTDAFADFARGPVIIGAIFMVLALLPLAVGAVLFARRRR